MPTHSLRIDSARALAMYDEGATDREISIVFGVSTSGVCYWRKRHGLVRQACNDNRLTESQVRRVKNMLRSGASRDQIAAHIGVSPDTVKEIRRKMDDSGLRRSGLCNASIRKSVLGDANLLQRIEKAIGLRVPTDVRIEAVNDMYADLLEGKLTVGQIETAASRFRSQAFKMAGFDFSTRSIDEEDDDGLTLADKLADPGSMRPFEEVLEQIFANDD